MKTLLKMPEKRFDEITAHLLPADPIREEAVFLFVEPVQSNSHLVFNVLDTQKLAPSDFASQCEDYLELADEARADLIKRAHDLGASLVEMHSHPGPFPAAFSYADRMGLKETVPHMWWRLKKRPYLAIVVSETGFDALLWLDNPRIPQALGGILAGARLLKPNNNSLKGWK